MPLHVHPEPATLVPLLRSQLPHSLVFLGTLLSNPDLAPVYANFPPRLDGEIDAAYLQSLGLGEYEWLVAAALPAPSEQLRVHHALCAAPEDVQAAELGPASAAVCAAITEMMGRYPAQPVIGAVPELFGPAVRQLLDAPKRDTTFIYAPEGGWGASRIDAGDDLAGLAFDVGRPGDAQAVSMPRHLLLTPVLRLQRIPLARLLPRAERVRDGAARRRRQAAGVGLHARRRQHRRAVHDARVQAQRARQGRAAPARRARDGARHPALLLHRGGQRRVGGALRQLRVGAAAGRVWVELQLCGAVARGQGVGRRA